MAQRSQQLRDDPAIQHYFVAEMRRFLPPAVVARTVENTAFWTYLTDTVQGECTRVIHFLEAGDTATPFIM
jgi:hypothetical protein